MEITGDRMTGMWRDIPAGSQYREVSSFPLSRGKTLALIVLIASVLFSFSGCRNHASSGPVLVSEITEGWKDGDTFVIISEGVPVKELANKWQRRTTAKKDAELKAREKIYAKFRIFPQGDIKGNITNDNFINEKKKIYNEIMDIIDKGEVYRLSYDEDDICVMHYKVSGKGLKEKVEYLHRN